jgi:Tfp pilus assembly protein PilO
MKASLLTTGWVVPLAMVAGATAYFGAIFMPGVKAIRQQADLLATQREFVAGGKIVAASIVANEQQSERAEKCVSAWKEVSPTDETLAALFGRIDAAIKDGGAVTTHFNPQEVEVLARVKRIPVAFGFNGKFSQIAKVLQSLESFPQTTWVDELRVEQAKENGKDVTCEIILSIFADNPEIFDKTKSAKQPI